MRLLRLQADDAGPTVDFHPYVTVVGGLSDPARARILAALTALPHGTDPGLGGLVESHGVLLDLDADTLRLLDLETDLDVVVRSSDLAEIEQEPTEALSGSAKPAGPDLATAQQAARDARAAYEVLRESLDALRESYREAATNHASLSTRLAAARRVGGTTGPPAAITSHSIEGDDLGSDGVVATATAVLEAGAVSPEAEAELVAAVARVERARSARDDVVAALEPLGDIDVGGVEGALRALREAGEAEPVPDPEAIALADELAEAEAAVEAHDRRLESEGRGPDAARRRLDDAIAGLRDLEAAQRPPTVDPGDEAALETAHEAVQAAEQRVMDARLSGKGLKKKLDEAVAAEQAILERMGFATYTAYVMSTTSPTVSPELKAQLDAAQEELVEAEAAFAETSAQWETDPERIALVNGAVAVREAAVEYVGATEERDLAKALRAMTVVPEGAGEEAERAAAQLRTELESVGVDFGDLELDRDDMADVATVWLADMADAARDHDRLAAELTAAEDEVRQAESDLRRLETSAARDLPRTSAPDRSPPAGGADHVDDHGGDDVDALEAEVAAAAALEAELEEKVDAQEALLAAADEVADAAEERWQRLEDQPPERDATEGRPDVPVEGTGVERLEWYLLARLASQRSVSYAGSVPLVVDDALSEFDDEAVRHLLGRLERMADAVQVVYLSEDSRVWDWAERAGLDRAAVVRPY